MRRTMHVVQAYRFRKRGGGLEAANMLQMRNEAAARERVRRLFDTGRYAGVDAYKVTGDPKSGKYDEPVFLVRLGMIPQAAE